MVFVCSKPKLQKSAGDCLRKRKEWLSPNKKATSRTKTCAHPQKIMLWIWCNSDGVLYYEFLPRGVTITADIYCQQLRRLADEVQEKQPTRLRQLMLLHDNATELCTNQYFSKYLCLFVRHRKVIRSCFVDLSSFRVPLELLCRPLTILFLRMANDTHLKQNAKLTLLH